VTKVLVVDDDPVILRLLKVNFEMEGYDVATASDGAEGLAAVRAARPDVIVSDIMMPKLDGLAFATAPPWPRSPSFSCRPRRRTPTSTPAWTSPTTT
jgi:PleD family two-component response regulator